MHPKSSVVASALLAQPPAPACASRFRLCFQVADLPVYGVAIPTVSGLRLVLDKLGAGAGRRKVLWHNQREEPVV